MLLMFLFLQSNDDQTILHYLARLSQGPVLSSVLESKQCQFTFDRRGNSPFHLAVLSKNSTFLTSALKAGRYEQLFVKTSGGEDPVQTAASQNDPAFLALLTSAVSDAVSVMSPRLYEGGRSGDLYAVASAISCGISPDQLDSSGRSVLSYACEFGHVDVAAWLLSEGASPLAGAPLKYAIPRGDLTLISLLVSRLPTPDTPDDSDETPLEHAVRLPFSPAVFRFLIRAGARYDVGSTTPLSVLLEHPTPAAVEALASCEIPLDSPNAYSLTHIACERRDARLLRAVLRCGGDPNFALDGKTPLEISVFDDLPPQDDFIAFEDIRALDVASFERTFGCAFLLCEYGASRTAALQRALERNDQVALFFLLLTGEEARGASADNASLAHQLVKFFSSHEETAIGDILIEARALLHLAINFAPPQVVSFLIAKGFDVDAPDERGLRPIHRAIACARFATVQVLIDESASVLAPSIRQPSLLHAVADAEAMITADAPTPQFNFQLLRDLVKHIVETSAPVDVTDTDGKTAFARACERKNFRFAEVLLKCDTRRVPLDAAAFFANLVEAAEPQADNPYSDAQLQAIADEAGEGFIANGEKLNAQATIRLAALYLEPERDRDAAARYLCAPVESQTGRTALHLACARSLCSLVRYMVLNGADPHDMEADGPSPIHEVLDAANAAVLRQLITESFQINRRDKQGRTPFAYACTHGNLEIFRILVDNGASVQTFDKQGQSPFSIACKNGNLEALDYLLANSKILPRRADNSRRAPIHLAAKFGHLPLVKKLWAASGMDTIRDIHGNTPLHRAVKPSKNRKRGHIDIVKFMSANPNLALEKNRDGETPLTLAANALDKAMVDFFFAFGLKFRPSESYQALRGALDARDASFIRDLLDHGLVISIRSGQNSIIDYAIEKDAFDFLRTLVDDSAFNPEDPTPLALAHLLGRKTVVDFFARLWKISNLDDFLNQFMPELADLPRSHEPVSISTRDSVKKLGEALLPRRALELRGVTVAEPDIPTALWAAFDRKDIATMEALLDLGANPNCCNAAGRPLLSQATKIGALPFVNLLLAHGASPDEPDAQTGCSPVYEALTCGHMHVLFALLPYGANINAIDGRGRSALTIAIEKRRMDIFELLLDIGANPGWVDDEGRIPLHWAVEARNERACKLLLENGSPTDVEDKKGQAPVKIAQVLNDTAIMTLLFTENC